MENNEIIVKEKNSKGFVILIILLSLIIVSLLCYIGYDKIIVKENNNVTEDNKNTTNEKINYTFDEISGNYKGQIQGVPAYEGDTGIISYRLILYNNGTFYYNETKEVETGGIGNYIIKDNKIVLNVLYYTGSDAAKRVFLDKNGNLYKVTYTVNINTDGTLQLPTKENKLVLTKSTEDINEFDNFSLSFTSEEVRYFQNDMNNIGFSSLEADK